MTATERLRALLDERGVEWASAHEWEGRTFWPNAGGVNATASDWGSGLLVHAVMSPEQAVEATLGRGTCSDLAVTPNYRDKTEFKCSACGYEYSAVGGFGCDSGDEPDFNYCPNCGRKVAE